MSTPLIKKQKRTTFLLITLIALCVAVYLYLNWRQSFVMVTAPTRATQQDINDAMLRYRMLPADEAAKVRSKGESTTKAELVFAGIPDEETMAQVVRVLVERQLSPTFFVTLDEAEKKPDSINLLIENGMRIGLLGNGTSIDMAHEDGESITARLCRSTIAIHADYGETCRSLVTTDALTEDMLRAAAAVGIDEVVMPGAVIQLSEMAGVGSAMELLEGMERESVVLVELDSRWAGDDLNDLLTALEETDLNRRAVQMLAAYENEDAEPAPQRVYTTERAVCLTFSGLGSSAEISGVLDALRAQGAQATFFVTAQQARERVEEIERILSDGHDLGILVMTELVYSEEEMLEEMLETQEVIEARYAYDRELLVRSSSAYASASMLRAANAGGFTLVSALTDVVKDDHLRATDAMEVVERLLPAGGRTLQRGEIVNFRMNAYLTSDTLLSEVVSMLLDERSIYPARKLYDVMNGEKCYTYPVPEEDKLPGVRDRIYAGQLDGDVMDAMKARYLGTDWINNTGRLPGFTRAEIRELDVSGLIRNDENMVFLTFDDWGTDETITSLLDVLKKHNARATFFIVTQNVSRNPNLLRAIAEEGHTIASHTHGHTTLSNAPQEGRIAYTTLTQEQAQALQEDLILSYETMESIIGDVAVDGVPALAPYFRPPTLAVSRIGMEKVFDSGFTWSISGSFSTTDYKVETLDELVDEINGNLRSGAIIVMHISDNSVYTAEAVDICLTQLEEKGRDYRFAALSEALGFE